jgi:hypothetical protein
MSVGTRIVIGAARAAPKKMKQIYTLVVALSLFGSPQLAQNTVRSDLKKAYAARALAYAKGDLGLLSRDRDKNFVLVSLDGSVTNYANIAKADKELLARYKNLRYTVHIESLSSKGLSATAIVSKTLEGRSTSSSIPNLRGTSRSKDTWEKQKGKWFIMRSQELTRQ